MSGTPPRRPAGDPTLEVAALHLPPEIEGTVRDWFAGRIVDYGKSGDRSVYLACPHGDFTHIKIKGAGLSGGPVHFGRHMQTGPVAPLFDFEGRRMVDEALGHDGAFVGGASFQQAVSEWQISAELARLGYDVVPCPGYGSVRKGPHRSWFSVFSWHDAWLDSVAPPHGTPALFEEMTRANGRLALDLALKHRLAGYFWFIRTPEGGRLIKDVHPFRRLDPLNQSQLSWVMQVYHALHTTGISHYLLAKGWFGEGVAEDAGLWMIWPFLPQATREDWDLLRFRVVAKFMNAEPKDFSPDALMDLLEANPITAKLLELCPPEFAPLR